MGWASLPVSVKTVGRENVRLTSQYNTSKLTQPWPGMAAPVRQDTAHENVVNGVNSGPLLVIIYVMQAIISRTSCSAWLVVCALFRKHGCNGQGRCKVNTEEEEEEEKEED